MLLILVLFLAIGPFRRTLDAVPQPWLVGAQIGRLVGFLVLSFGLAGTIPMSFAGPAGWGDGITGLFAPVVAFMLYRRVPGAALAALIWNAWGLGDLINVARLASLSTPGTSAFDPGMGDNSNFSLFPTGLLQVLYGPLYILLHVFSIRALVRRALGRPRSSPERLTIVSAVSTALLKSWSDPATRSLNTFSDGPAGSTTLCSGPSCTAGRRAGPGAATAEWVRVVGCGLVQLIYISVAKRERPCCGSRQSRRVRASR